MNYAMDEGMAFGAAPAMGHAVYLLFFFIPLSKIRKDGMRVNL